MAKALKVYFVLGEPSGDALAADLLPGLAAEAKKQGFALEPVGLAGVKLSALGVNSLFDISDISVMGVSAVVARLPKIVRRVKRTVEDIKQQNPDVVILVDSPDFTHAVGKRVRRQMADLPIIKYVCPSVWAWRPERAQKMKAFVDHVLTILPFEPDVLQELDGPEATYVGHPIADREVVPSISSEPETKAKLLVLPGSRSSEITRLLPVFEEALLVLRNRGVEFEVVLPAVPHLRSEIENRTANWHVRPTIVSSEDNEKTFRGARAALASSGTVSLQLALNHVPMVLTYRLDPMANRLRFLVKAWSGALPNLIAGWPLVSEYYNEYVNPQKLARELERLLSDSPERQAQLAGFEEIAKIMRTQVPTSQAASEAIFSVLKRKSPRIFSEA